MAAYQWVYVGLAEFCMHRIYRRIGILAQNLLCYVESANLTKFLQSSMILPRKFLLYLFAFCNCHFSVYLFTLIRF